MVDISYGFPLFTAYGLQI